MSNPFFENNNWLLITDGPVTGKSIRDFKPANPNSPYSIWGVLREGPMYEQIIPVFESVKNLIEEGVQIDDRPFKNQELNGILKNLKSRIDYYLEYREEPIDGYKIKMQDSFILIDLRNNAIWDRPLSTMIRLHEILFHAKQTGNTIYLNTD